MSNLIYLASDNPLPKLQNPHEHLLSVKEALSLGIKVPDWPLKDTSIDHKKPIILWIDRNDEPASDTKSIQNDIPDDDFSIIPMQKQEDIFSEKRYCASLEWSSYTKGRARRLISYIRQQLEHTPSLEIWHIWMGISYPPPKIIRTKLPAEKLDEKVIEKLDAMDVFTMVPLAGTCRISSDWEMNEDELMVGVQYCYEIAAHKT